MILPDIDPKFDVNVPPQKLSPLHIDIIFKAHCHSFTPATDIQEQYADQLVVAEIITKSSKQANRYAITQRGIAHVHQICALPFPKMAWVDHLNKIIKHES